MLRTESLFQVFTFVTLVSLFACGGGGDAAPVSGDQFPSRADKYNSATDFYGPLVVKQGEVFAQADKLPWAGYWLPSNNQYMFQSTDPNNLAPLQKYDEYMKNVKGQTTIAAQFEQNNLYNPLAGPADGHCDAWSIASLYENDPTPGTWQSPHNATLNGITFSPGDLKALLVDIYEQQSLVKMYGEKYQGPQDDFMDIYPDQFQKVLEQELFGRNHPVIIDRDPGADVWNTPIYSADITMTPDSSDPHVMHVNALIGTVNAIDEFAFAQTPEWQGDPTQAIFNQIYTYDLYGDTETDGTFQVHSGMWTGDSLTDHPDFALTMIDGATAHSSLNTQVQNSIVYEIISRAQQVSQ